MQSPFPGMDPYLEGSEWMSVHTELSVEIARLIAPQLPRRYVARTTKRWVTDTSEPNEALAISASFLPDAMVARSTHGETGGSASGTALAVAPPALRMPTVMPEFVPLVTVEIRETREMRLVTAIELISPTNKRGDGLKEYRAKREHLLRTSAHLMEIDLHRTGTRVPMLNPLPRAPYFVFLSRREFRPLTDIWPIRLDEPLPTVPVPLLPGDSDVAVDLQRAFANVYDTYGYHVTIDYTKPPEVPLSGDDARWAAERVKAWSASRNGE